MKLIFKQRMLSWLDSYDIYDEFESIAFTVKGHLSWGHLFKVYDSLGYEIGTVKQKLWNLLPTFEIYQGDQVVGTIRKEFTILKPRYNIDYNGWHVEGNFLEWDYRILNQCGQQIATVTKEIWHWTDTYTIDIYDSRDAVSALMLVLAIDAEKCSRN